MMGFAGRFWRGDDAAQFAIMLIELTEPGALPLPTKRVRRGLGVGLFPGAMESDTRARAQEEAKDSVQQEVEGDC